ncbi:MAG: hypothetical protein JWP81_2823 [Ferruginibacter sp.]|nr:hypothetical protein [Ferruginibacter sp.]
MLLLSLYKLKYFPYPHVWRKRTLAKQLALAFAASMSGGLSELACLFRQQKEVIGIE